MAGRDGRPEVERYENTVAKVTDGHRRVVERQQLYQNTATGYEKAGHERTLDRQGRKVIHERLHGSGEERYVDLYHNLEESTSGIF